MANSASSNPGSSTLKIGQLSKLAELPIHTLRFYGAEGLLCPDGHTASGYRLYRRDAVARLQFVIRARSLGMPLRSIAAILKAADAGGPPCEHVSAVVRGQLERVGEQLVRLTDLRAKLTELQHRLEAEPAGRSGDYGICPCLEGMSGRDVPTARV